ncbi:MAG TPA: response regulator transcription factor [Myxococcales bacterium LLY-WYZ-16_1]|nr:response regulator transcription factor [Myxococcales bacterium LLY-WYZ-16_1]
MMSNQGNTAPMTPPVSEAPQELVMVFADQVPPQLEHWLRKRSMRLQMNEASAIRPDDIRASGARYVILDAEALPAGQDPVELVRNLRQSIPELRITVSTARGDDAYVRNLTEAGAQGVVVKQPYVADLVFALQAEAEGRSFVSGRATERERAAVQITAREREVLELMANGHSNQAIGERLSISVKTVEAHRARLFKKLGASNVADAVLLAIRTGLVMP